MESIEQNSSTTKRKYSPDESQISFVDLEEESSKKFFSAQTMTTNPYPAQRPSLGNYQQTTKIIQEFNIQQSSNHHSDITVSSTINIKSTGKSASHVGDLLSEADFQRVVQDITPADRDLFDEFLNGIKQRTDDYLFLSSFDDLPSQTHSQQRFSSHHHHPRGSNTIHYGPNAQSSPLPTSPASQTLKQMAVQHQQRLNHHHHNHNHHQQQQQQQQHHFEQYQTNIYPTYPSTENQYYSSTSTSHGSDLTHPNDSNRFYFQQHPSSVGYSSGSSQMYPSSYPNVSYYPSSTSINTHPNTLHISDDYLP